ncbi:HalOD1 output domain-containing protein [Halopiger aswanensis]|uniref:HalOD1 output domain-containing protein n=1 Tax=Halopiger aswanensis TaxID=148449 RepID=UPI000E754C63|nr:HalOD1 output domain-containing protein [Halopiger aswanensis]
MQDSNPVVRVVNAVADREGVDPVELTPPLHSVIDTDALDALFQSPSQQDRSKVCVEFRYKGYLVRVTGSDEVEVVDYSLRADTDLEI